MDLITWLIVGLLSGVLASLAVGGSGYGIIGDIVVGIAGAVIGGALFSHMHWAAPFGGLAGTVTVAFIGACILLVALHIISRSVSGPRRL